MAAGPSSICDGCLLPAPSWASPRCPHSHWYHPACVAGWRVWRPDDCPGCVRVGAGLDAGLWFRAPKRGDAAAHMTPSISTTRLLTARAGPPLELTAAMLVPRAFPADLASLSRAQYLAAEQAMLERAARVLKRSGGVELMWSGPELAAWRSMLGWSKRRWIRAFRAHQVEDLPSDDDGRVSTEMLVRWGLGLSAVLDAGYSASELVAIWPGLTIEDWVVWGLSATMLGTREDGPLLVATLAHVYNAGFSPLALPDFSMDARLPGWMNAAGLDAAGIGAPLVWALTGDPNRMRDLYGTLPRPTGSVGPYGMTGPLRAKFASS